MLPLLIVTVFFVVLFAIAETRRFARIRYLERAERLHTKLSATRHRLVMFAGSGAMRSSDKQAFIFLYEGLTTLLRYPAFYRQITNSTIRAMLEDDRNWPPVLHRRDFSNETLTVLREFVGEADEMLQTFAHWILVALASLDGQGVREWVQHINERARAAEAQKQLVQKWRDAGQQPLDEYAAAA